MNHREPDPKPNFLNGRETERRVAGTAVMLLEKFCFHQKEGARRFPDPQHDQPSSYTISESMWQESGKEYKTLSIYFKGSSNSRRKPGPVLQLELERSSQQGGHYQIANIRSWLTSEDIERFTHIRNELHKDIEKTSIKFQEREL